MTTWLVRELSKYLVKSYLLYIYQLLLGETKFCVGKLYILFSLMFDLKRTERYSSWLIVFMLVFSGLCIWGETFSLLRFRPTCFQVGIVTIVTPGSEAFSIYCMCSYINTQTEQDSWIGRSRWNSDLWQASGMRYPDITSSIIYSYVQRS